MKAISVENLKCSYDGKTKILDGISFEIEAGQYVGIVGDSGCGKSTLCHILCGIIPGAVKAIVSGDVVLRKLEHSNGYALNADKLLSGVSCSAEIDKDINVKEINLRGASLKDLAETIGFVMQDSDRQIVTSTVEDELAFGPENLCMDPEEIRKRVDDVAELLNIGGLLLQNPNNLGYVKNLVEK